ncbi:MAG: LytTR family DNA-binding domain-containing protein [Hydrogenophaga sp.]|uniref:LytR/AlgR family response regulator transcription factor n=1 Tax=Hydrogenophaga sp. TaxID=1904254 RepID=UPI0027361CC3|nr:LytTR family DNA-binding domain-containing protein [Hydrogenophaga sp.]MDP3349591.1 LytTR family DNA-binding domain-containing protein [Hydrogenophaga sp.]
MNATALIAEDEPLLAQALQAELALAWPELNVVKVVGDGEAAVAQALALRPDVLLLDIRMPGQSGLEAAGELAEEWPDDQPFPALVFVTAYDAYAVQAFEAQAVDYLLKPVQPERLRLTVQRVQALLAQRRPATGPLDATLEQLRSLMSQSSSPAARLQVIPASVGNSIRMVQLSEVVAFEAADKYVRVLMAQGEVLIRTPLKELMPQLDPAVFWQVHRGTVVRAEAIESVTRNEAGRMSLRLRARPESFAVSRLYADRFKAM